MNPAIHNYCHIEIASIRFRFLINGARMDDLVKTMKAQLYDRVSSPLIFTFCASWAVWNYRLILIVLSSSSATDKFLQIDMLPVSYPWLEVFESAISSSWAYWLLFRVIGPLATTLLYLRVLPYFEGLAFELAQKKIVNLKNIKLRAENEIPLDPEDGRQLRQSLRDAEKRWDETMESQKELLTKEKSEAVAKLKALEVQAAADRKEFERTTADSSHKLHTLKSERDAALAEQQRAKSLLTQIMFLEQAARNLFNHIAAQESGLSLHSPTDSKLLNEDNSLEQLISIGLVEQNGGSIKLSHLGESLHLERMLNAAVA